jgi:hypothetical protein
VQTTGEPATTGFLCAALWAVVCNLLYSFTLPRLRQLPLQASWGRAALRRQKAILAEVGFERPIDAQSGLSDNHAADMFAWMCLTAFVHLIAGLMVLQLILLGGWYRVGSGSHLIFYSGTWLALGWCLFDIIDGTFRCFGRALLPMGLSGMSCPCPVFFWSAMCVTQHPFYLTLILPMNEVLADLGQYHTLVCALILGAGLEVTLMQAALVLGVMGRHYKTHHRLALALHAVVVLVCRGGLFFSLTLECAGKLGNIEPAKSQILIVPAILMGLFNFALIMDAIRATLWCTGVAASPPPATQQSIPLRAESGSGVDTLDSEATNSVRPQSGSSQPTRDAPAKAKGRPRPKGSHRGVRKDGDEDEEMTFGFASAESIDIEYNDMDGTTDGRAAGRQSSNHPRGRNCSGSSASSFGGRPTWPKGKANGAGAERLGRSAPVVPPVRVPEPQVDHDEIFATGQLQEKASHYAMLGVSRIASDVEIKKAFHKLSMRWHPDKNPEEKTKAELIFMAVRDAYECLSDPVKRRRHDKLFPA